MRNTQTALTLSPERHANLKLELLALPFTPHSRDIEAASRAIANRYGLSEKALPAHRAWLSMNARKALEGCYLSEMLETDLRLLTLHKVKATLSGHDTAACDAELNTTAARLNIPILRLRRAVARFSETLLAPTARQEVSSFSNLSVKRSEALLPLSKENRRALRRAVLSALALGDPEPQGTTDSKLAKSFGVKQNRIPAIRAWVGKIFLKRLCQTKKLNIGEEAYPAIIKVAATINQEGLTPSSKKRGALTDRCAKEIGIPTASLTSVLTRYLSRF